MRKRTLLGIILVAISLWISARWDNLPTIKHAVNTVLNPTLGVVIETNAYIGLLVATVILSFLLTLAQKYLTNQRELRELKKEQKKIQKQMKEYREHPEKMLELNKKSMELFPEMMKHSMGSILYTILPIVLLFRWFGDTLQPVLGNWWIFYYIVGAMIFSSIFRKWMNVA